MTDAQSQVSDEFFLRRNGDNYSFHYKGGHRPATDAEIYFWQQYQDSKRVQPPEVSKSEFDVSLNPFTRDMSSRDHGLMVDYIWSNFTISRRVGGA